MASPVVLHVRRPYADAEEYLRAEAWTIEERAMLLIDQAPLDKDTPIVFDVTLKDGSRPIKAEAKVTRHVEPEGERPGGLRVRFKRYGAPTKAFIERAVASVARGDSVPPAPMPAPSDPLAVAEAPPPEIASSVEHVPPAATPAALDPQDSAPTLMLDLKSVFRPGPVAPTGSPDVEQGLASLRARNAGTPETPPNREGLLEKLRQRGQNEDETSQFQRPL
ncbi:MAG TPA: hypothetical protein VFV94_03420 [Polyangiaceae bacterium]|nr:hypothetical protein [Polyangiaceae bacterium]